MNTWIARLIPVIYLFSWSLFAQAAVYRCVDKAGNIVFTQDHCGPGEQGELVKLGSSDNRPKPGPAVCKKVEKLAGLIFPHIKQTDSILDMYTALGGREYLSAGITAAVNYVYNFRYNPKARQSNVVALTRDKCLDGGFGLIKEKDLPDWSKITYTRDKPKQTKQTREQDAERLKDCQKYTRKLVQLRERLNKAKSKSDKMQARVNLEYQQGLVKDRCGKAAAN